MIRVLMLDFGETLVHWETPFPHVPASLTALKQFRVERGIPLQPAWVADGHMPAAHGSGQSPNLQLALVADCHMPAADASPAQIDQVFQDYLAILEAAGLRSFFEPVARHVTLSAHAGALKPDPRVFRLALTRLGLLAAWDECLIISDDQEQLAACRQLGMSTLRFSRLAADEASFRDWSEAPLLVALRIAAQNTDNLCLGLGVYLAARHGLQLITVDEIDPDGRVRATVKPIRRHGATAPAVAAGVHEDRPVPITVRLTALGRVAELETELLASDLGPEAEWSTSRA